VAWLDTIRANSSLTASARELACLLAKYQTGNDRYSMTVVSEAAYALNTSPTGVLGALDELEAKGHLRRLHYGPEFQINVALMMPAAGKAA
jgi:DNA-binding MarR family transcriptional regulator